MNAKEALQLVTGNSLRIDELTHEELTAINDACIRALRLLAAAEANDGSTVDACVMEIVELVDDIVTAARLTQFYEDPRYKPWSEQVWRSVDTARRAIRTRRKVLERIATERNALAARVRELGERLKTMQPFFDTYALGPLAKPSCLCCGRSDYESVAVQHGELPGIVICDRCKSAAALEENAKLAARVAELEAALDRYGCHADSCGDMDAMNGAEIKSCNCGLDAARRTK